MITIVYSLLSLGRNIGFIPAQCRLVTRGAYRFVRHPIYTGTFISLFAFVLRAFSPLNLTIAVALVALLMVRGLVEEHFLREDPAYAASPGSPLALASGHCLEDGEHPIPSSH